MTNIILSFELFPGSMLWCNEVLHRKLRVRLNIRHHVIKELTRPTSRYTALQAQQLSNKAQRLQLTPSMHYK